VKDKDVVSKLEKLIHGMDLPFNRKSYLNPAKLRWLQKNMAERNKDNPNFIEASILIQKLIDNG
jgi:hypothetical protein